MIKVMIADDQAIIREGLKKILSLDEDIQVVCEAENGNQVLNQLSTFSVDVILMDVRMPLLDGVKASAKVKENDPNVKVILLTTFNESDYLFEGINNGISGYLLKDSDLETITKSIKDVYANKMVFDSSVTPKLVAALTNKQKNRADLSVLTAQEKQIAQLVSKGKSNREIAETLFITEGTAKNYISKILEKLELERRTQIAVYLLNSLEDM